MIRDLFAEFGLQDAELEMKARTFVMYCSLEHSMLVRQSKRDRLKEARSRVDMLLLPLAGRSGDHERPAADVRSTARPGS